MNNFQQPSDWTSQLQQLRQIQQSITGSGYLGKAIASTRAFLTNFQFDSLGSRFEEIEKNYLLMCEFLKKGYQDDKREELYNSLLGKLYVLLRDIELDYRKAYDPSVIKYTPAKSAVQLDVEEIRQKLEAFVSDVAMASLEPEDIRKTKLIDLYSAHHQYIQTVFNSLLLSHQWTHDIGMNMARVLVSPTIDSKDAQLLVSAIMLGAMISGDPERMLTMIYIHQHAHDVYLKQRAMVGWVFALDSLSLSMFPQVYEHIQEFLNDKSIKRELYELQIQMVYCRNAKRDNEKLQRDIMPTLLRNQSFEINGFEIREKEENTIEDILNPDAADQKMEEMEKSIRKMMDMRDQGVDIYFGGFSQMKRFSFFYTLPNWFIPFSTDHPHLQHLASDFLHSNMVETILKSGSFCDSDKYSFVLGMAKVYNNIPANIKEMLNSGNVAMMGMGEEQINTQDSSYIRRMYLQDLYRFFSLCDAHAMFDNPFERPKFLFMTNEVFRKHMGTEARSIQKFLLKKKMYSSLSQMFYTYKEVNNIEDMRMEAGLKMRAHKYNEAQAIYAQLCDASPDDQRAIMGYAQASFYVGDYAEAARLYKQLLYQYPDNRSIALNLAISQINSDNAEEGMKLLFRLDYENEKDINVKRALAWGHLWLKNIDQADELYQSILANKMCDASDFLNAGYCNWFAGRVDMAITLIKQSIATSENVVESTDDLMRQFEKDLPLLVKYGVKDTDRKMVAEMVMG